MRPVLEYSSPAWSTTAKTNQQSLDKIQNQALRIISGAMKSTPITFMEQTTAIKPLQQRRQPTSFFKQRKCLPDHPMKEKVESRTKNRIKRSSFTHEIKKLQKDYPAVLTSPIPVITLLLKSRSTPPSFNLTREKNWMPLSDVAWH